MTAGWRSIGPAHSAPSGWSVSLRWRSEAVHRNITPQRGNCPGQVSASRWAVGHHQQGRDHLTATGWGDAYELQLLPPPGLDVERIFVAELDLAEPPSIRRA